MRVKELIVKLSNLDPELIVAVEDGQDPSERVPVDCVQLRTSETDAHWEPVPKGEKYVYLS